MHTDTKHRISAYRTIVAKKRAYIAELRKHATSTRTFFSNPMKQQRERAVCRAFLRAMGMRFAEGEIVAPCQEPIDVGFRDAKFQIRDELLSRRRGDAWRQREVRWGNVRTMSALLEPAMWPKPMRRVELVELVAKALKAKSEKYGLVGCAQTDALIYADVTDKRFLLPRSTTRNLATLEGKGWRSVSVLFPPFGLVLLARINAPEFLRLLVGKTRKTCRKPNGLFTD